MSRTLAALAVLTLAAILTSIGCKPEYTLYKTTGTTCSATSCSKDVTIYFEGCLDNLWVDDNWVDGVPQEVVDACTPPSDSCTLASAWADSFANPGCDCVELSEPYKDGELAEALVLLEERSCDAHAGCCPNGDLADLGTSDQESVENGASDIIAAIEGFGCFVDVNTTCGADPWTCSTLR